MCKQNVCPEGGPALGSESHGGEREGSEAFNAMWPTFVFRLRSPPETSSLCALEGRGLKGTRTESLMLRRIVMQCLRVQICIMKVSCPGFCFKSTICSRSLIFATFSCFNETATIEIENAKTASSSYHPKIQHLQLWKFSTSLLFERVISTVCLYLPASRTN